MIADLLTAALAAVSAVACLVGFEWLRRSA